MNLKDKETLSGYFMIDGEIKSNMDLKMNILCHFKTD